MSSRKSDVLNKTWTLIDEKDIIDENENEYGDDINNNTRCILNNETYLSTSINKNKKIIEKNINSSNSNNNVNDLTVDLDKTVSFSKLFNIDNDYYVNGLKSIDSLILRSLDFDLVQSEPFFEANIENDEPNNDIFNEKPALLSTSTDDQFTNSIPQSFDLFLHDLNSNRNSKEIKNNKEKEYLDAYKRSISENDLKTLDSISSASNSTSNLLEVKTSSPLKKRSFFGSVDDEEEDMDREYDEEEKDKPVFNLTYTSLNTNGDQIEQDFINQNLNNNNNQIESGSDENINRNSNNLNRTFCIDDNKKSSVEDLQNDDNAQLSSLLVIKNSIQITNKCVSIANNKNQTIIIDEPKKIDDDSIPFASLPVNIHKIASEPNNLQSTQQPQSIKPQLSTANLNSKIPKCGIPRSSSRLPTALTSLPSLKATTITPQTTTTVYPTSTSISSSTVSSSTSSSSSIYASASTPSPTSLTSLPQLSEVKNQIKSALPSLTRKISPLKSNQIPSLTQTRPMTVASTSKENKIVLNEPSKKPLSMVKINEYKSSPSSTKVTSLIKQPSLTSNNNNTDTKKSIPRPTSMIPSFKSTISKPSIPVYKK